MELRNILYISYYFPPMGLSGVQRTAKFVKYLSDYGWNVHVLTVTPETFYAFDGSLMDDFDGKSIQIHRTTKNSKKKHKVRKFPSYSVQKIGRFVLSFIFQPDSKIRWKKLAIELGGKIIEVYEDKLADAERFFVVIEKMKCTPRKYPRENGVPRMTPLK